METGTFYPDRYHIPVCLLLVFCKLHNWSAWSFFIWQLPRGGNCLPLPNCLILPVTDYAHDTIWNYHEDNAKDEICSVCLCISSSTMNFSISSVVGFSILIHFSSRAVTTTTSVLRVSSTLPMTTCKAVHVSCDNSSDHLAAIHSNIKNDQKTNIVFQVFLLNICKKLPF